MYNNDESIPYVPKYYANYKHEIECACLIEVLCMKVVVRVQKY